MSGGCTQPLAIGRQQNSKLNSPGRWLSLKRFDGPARGVHPKVRDKPLQLGVLLLKLAQPLYLGRHQPGVPPSACFKNNGDLRILKLRCLHGTLHLPVEG